VSRAQPTLSSNGFARAGLNSPVNSVIGVTEATTWTSSYLVNNKTQDAVWELVPGQSLWGPGVLGRSIALKDLDYIRVWTKRDFLTPAYHDWYVRSAPEMGGAGDGMGWREFMAARARAGIFPF
jgi:hypothetical protein